MPWKHREKPSWGITKTAATGAIVIRFVGPTRTWEIPEFLAAIGEMMPEEDATLIFDLRQLDGYNPESKEPIKSWLKQNKPRIKHVLVLVPEARSILKIAVAAIGLASGVRIRVSSELSGEASVANV